MARNGKDSDRTRGAADIYGVTDTELRHAPKAIDTGSGKPKRGRGGNKTRTGLPGGSYTHTRGEQGGVADSGGDRGQRARAFRRRWFGRG